MRALVLLLLLGACGARGTPEAPAADPALAAACRAEAERDPEVTDLIMKGAGSPTFLAESQDDLKVARQRATIGCLRARGAIRPGGVERQKPL